MSGRPVDPLAFTDGAPGRGRTLRPVGFARPRGGALDDTGSKPYEDKAALAGAYDDYAEDYSSRFADADAIASRQVSFVKDWGSPLRAGARVLEVGCADGYVTRRLAGAGLTVTAVDLSPRMIEQTGKRLSSYGLRAELLVGDVEALDLEGPFDAVIACMRTFFRYVGDPERALARITDLTQCKVIVDVDPRQKNLSDALALVQAGGLWTVWRPLFVPQNYRLPRLGLAALRAAELTPVVREAILRRKFNVVIKGEKP